MSLIIKGMKLPLPGNMMVCALIDGKLQCSIVTRDKSIEWCEALEIPTPHGRLIDADALVNRIKNNYCNKCTAVEECGICVCQNCGVATLFDEIENSTTIIEAEVSEE